MKSDYLNVCTFIFICKYFRGLNTQAHSLITLLSRLPYPASTGKLIARAFVTAIPFVRQFEIVWRVRRPATPYEPA